MFFLFLAGNDQKNRTPPPQPHKKKPPLKKMALLSKMSGLMMLAATLSAGACVSASVVAANVHRESACSGTQGGRVAYSWAWKTAIASGVMSGACVVGLLITK